jgi:branched-chain amino acid transport system substrate-binding protein
VVVGHVGTYSGVFSGFSNGPKALEAWSQALNAKGGIDGHAVRVIIAEDGGDPARHRALVQQLVEQQGVIAFVDCFCPTTGQAAVDYLTKKGVPMVGGSPSSEWYYDSPMYFPQGSAGKKGVVHAILGGTAEIAVPLHKTKLAVLACNEAQICKNLSGDMPSLAPQFGMKVVSQAQASLAQPDYTAECLAARNAGADVMFLAFDPNSYGRVADSCNSIGYKPLFSLVPDATNSLTSIDSMDGAIVYSGVFPWFDTSNPSIAEMHRAMALYTPRAEADQTAGDDWVAAQMFDRAARGHLSATPTSQDILAGLWSIKNDTIDGLTYPITFVQGRNADVQHCWWVAVIHDHKFTSPNRNVRCV